MSMDRYGHFGVDYKWVFDFFNTENYWNVSTLGINLLNTLKRFLIDAAVIDKHGRLTDLGIKVKNIGIESEVAWGYMLVNLSYTSEFNWWVININPNTFYSPEYIIDMISETEKSKIAAHNIIAALKRIFSTNAIISQDIGFGICETEESPNGHIIKAKNFSRSKWLNPDPYVILYALYKYAEACQCYQFSLYELINDWLDKPGVSPVRMFGINKETMIRILSCLSEILPDYIVSSDPLIEIKLSIEKSSNDIILLEK